MHPTVHTEAPSLDQKTEKPHAAARWTEVALELAMRHGVTVADGLYLPDMIRQYVETALRKARHGKLGDGTLYGEVPRLRGVLVHEGVPR